MKLKHYQTSWWTLLSLMVAYTGLFIAYFPKVAAIEDEIGFINQTIVWSKGAMTAEAAGYPTLADFQELNGRHVPSRHIGRSLVALPFLIAFGLPGVFVSGLLLHLTMTIIGAILLVRLGRSPLWAALLLFHPSLALYSRTALADGSAGTFLMLAALATVSTPTRGFLSGIAVGLAALMRAHAGMALPIVAASLRFPPRDRNPWRDVMRCLVGGIVVGGLNMGYNQYLYGSMIDPFSSRRGYFSTVFFLPHSLFYAGCLLIIWPGMFLAPFFDRSAIRWLVRGVCGLNFILFSFYYFHDESSRFIETLVIGQRLIQVAIPLWVVSYAVVCDERIWSRLSIKLSHWAKTSLVVVGLLTMFIGNWAIFATHQRHLERFRIERDSFAAVAPSGSLVICHGQFPKLFGIPLGINTYRMATLNFNGQPIDVSELIATETSTWYLVVLDVRPGDPLPEASRDLIAQEGLIEIHVTPPRLHVFQSPSGSLAKP